jgi:hypothetical protein
MRSFANVAVIGVVTVMAVGLVLAGIAKARDMAAKSQCQKNLRELGIGLHNYDDFYGRFPAATVQGTQLPAEKRLNWLYESDPHIWGRMDPTWHNRRLQPWDAEANRYMVEPGLNFVHCPGHPDPEKQDRPWLTHYVGLTGVGRDAAMLEKADPKCGLFGYDRIVSINPDWVDGTSQTVVVTETAHENGPWIAGGYASVRGLEMDWQPIIGKGAQFGGCHRGGAMMLFGDASVRFVHDSIQPSTLAALITIAGRDEPGLYDADEYPGPRTDR